MRYDTKLSLKSNTTMQNDLLSTQRDGQENNLLVGFSRFYDTAIELILIGLLVFTPLVFGTVQVWSISVMHLATLFMLALWFLKMNAQGRFRLVRTPLDLPILAFGAIAVVSTVTSVYFYESKVELFKILNYILLYYIVVNNIKDFRRIKRVITILIVIGCGLAVYGLYNYLNGIEMIYGLEKKAYVGNLTATYVNSNSMSAYLELTIPLAIGLFLSGILGRQPGQGKDRRSIATFLLPPAIFVMTAALIFTFSRDGWISFFASILLLSVILIRIRHKTPRTLTRIAVIVLIILIILGTAGSVSLYQAVKSKNKGSVSAIDPFASVPIESRIELYRGTLQMIADRPLFGVGPGNFPLVYPRYRDKQHIVFMNENHNDYLQFASEMGIFSLAAFLVLLFLYFKYANKYLLSSKNMYLLGLALGCTVSIAGVALHGSMDFPFQIPANALTFWVILGLTVNISRAINLHEVKEVKVSEKKS